MTKQPSDLTTPALTLTMQQVTWTELPAWLTPVSLLMITYLSGRTSLQETTITTSTIKVLAGNIPIC